MTHLYLQEIPLDEEARADLRAIPSQKEAGQQEIEEKTKLFFKKFKEKLKNEYPFLNFNWFNIAFDESRDKKVCIVFKPHCGWSHNEDRAIEALFHLNFDNNKYFREYCRKEFEKKFGKELEEIPELKKKINYLEKKLKSCEKDFDYTKIQYKNLNDLNSAKFLSDDEKRLICGLLPKSKKQ